MEFVIEGDEIVVRPARSEPNPFAKYKGIVEAFPGGIGEINAWVADMRDDEPEQE